MQSASYVITKQKAIILLTFVVILLLLSALAGGLVGNSYAPAPATTHKSTPTANTQPKTTVPSPSITAPSPRTEQQPPQKNKYFPDEKTVWSHKQAIQRWISVFKAAVAGYSDISSAKDSLDEKYFKFCWQDSHYLRLFSDPLCSMLWFRKLAHEEVSNIVDLLPVVPKKDQDTAPYTVGKPTMNGGMKCNLVDGVNAGYWKPCYGNTDTHEDYRGEVMASVMDKLAGFYRTASVSPRFFTTKQLNAFANDDNKDDYSKEKMGSILKYCSATPNDKESGAEGAMVGWTAFPITRLKNDELKKDQLVEFRKFEKGDYEKYLPKFNVTNDSSFEKKRFVVENIMVHQFSLLCGYLGKFQHNIYLMNPREGNENGKAGPFMYIDNDRCSWHHGVERAWHFDLDNPMCNYCKFPKYVADRLYILDASKEETLGKLMQKVGGLWKNRSHLHSLFSSDQVAIIDSNVNLVVRCMNKCVEKHGAENVFIDDPYTHEFSSTFDLLANIYDEEKKPEK